MIQKVEKLETAAPGAADYAAAFELERVNEYPAIDAVEARFGHAIERGTLETIARVLACPVKRNAPSWQHGRVIYAVARSLFEARRAAFDAAPKGSIRALDIGTAKGFSAVMIALAARDAGVLCPVTSVDVVDPLARVPRNSVADLVPGFSTVPEAVALAGDVAASALPMIQFDHCPGIAWLDLAVFGALHTKAVPFAFVDGKHDREVVIREGSLLARLQTRGDVVIFDDCQIPSVASAVERLTSLFEMTFVEALAADRPRRTQFRRYAIGVRR